MKVKGAGVFLIVFSPHLDGISLPGKQHCWGGNEEVLSMSLYEKQLFMTFCFLPSIGKEMSSLKGVSSSRMRRPVTRSSTTVWNGPRALTKPSLGTQITLRSFSFMLLRLDMLFKSRKSMRRSYHLKFDKLHSTTTLSREDNQVNEPQIEEEVGGELKVDRIDEGKGED